MSIFKNSLVTIFSPNDSNYIIKKNLHLHEGIFIYLLVCISRIFQIYYTHSPLNSTPPQKADLFIEILKLLVPLCLWVISSYAVTIINDGESKFIEIFVVTAYSLLPYVIITIFITIFSNVISLDEIFLYNFILSFMWVWVAVLFYIQVRDLNNYEFFHTIKIIFMSMFGMVLLAAILALLYLLTINVIEFIKAIYFELNIILLK